MDTNVAVVADGRTPQAGTECVLSCIDKIEQIQKSGLLLLDDGRLIIEEYRKNLCPSGQPGPGSAFFKWIFQNQANNQRCKTIEITPDGHGSFAEFPNDEDLVNFDEDDKKFVAVALASGMSPQILNASDTDWWCYRDTLMCNGVQIEFICPELMSD